MNYDDAKQEAPEDREWRLHVHDCGPRLTDPPERMCACGERTERSVAGIGWQCHRCGEAALRRQFERRSRTA